MNATVIVRRVRRRLPASVIAAAETPAPLIWDEAELCRALRIGATTAALWRSQGMPYIQRGRVVRFIAADVLAWLAAQTVRESPSDGPDS